MKSYLSHNTPNKKRRQFQEAIVKSFEELNEIKEIEPLLKFVATSTELRIIFDFSCDSVDLVDPFAPEDASGVTYCTENCITIGARGLLDEQQRFSVYGTLVHELCHFAMNLLYGSDRKPYHIDDELKRSKYQEIVEICCGKRNYEQLIALAFDCYPTGKWHCELIVRVPHLLAFYKNQPAKLEEVRKNSANFLFFISKKFCQIWFTNFQ